MAILIAPAVTVTVTNSRTSKVERGRQGEHRAGVSPRASEPGRGRGAFSREVMGREGAKLCATGSLENKLSDYELIFGDDVKKAK